MRRFFYPLLAAFVALLFAFLPAGPALADTPLLGGDQAFQNWYINNRDSIYNFFIDAYGSQPTATKYTQAVGNLAYNDISLGLTDAPIISSIDNPDRIAQLSSAMPECTSFKAFLTTKGCTGWSATAEDGTRYWADGKQYMTAVTEKFGATPVGQLSYPASAVTEGVTTDAAKAQRLAMASSRSGQAIASVAVEDAAKTGISRSGIFSALGKSATGPISKLATTTLGKLIVGAGVLGDIYAGQQLGTWIGGAYADALFSMWGLDKDQVVCDSTNGSDFGGWAARYFSGADCAKIANAEAAAQVPSDVTASGGFCTSKTTIGTVCINFSGPTYFYTTSADGYKAKHIEFSITSTGKGATGSLVNQNSHRQWLPSGIPLTLFEASDADLNPNFCMHMWNSSSSTCADDSSGSLVLSDPKTDPQQWKSCVNYADGSQACSTSPDTFTRGDSSIPTPSVGGPAVNSSGSPATSVDVKQHDTKTGEDEDSGTLPTTQGFQNLAKNDPECLDGTCVLDLKQNATNKSCFGLHDTCDGWMQDVSKQTDYTCTYNNKTVDLSECTVYANSFSAETKASGQTLSDPDTGKDLGGEVTSEPQSSQAADTANCWASGWSWNPLDWVLTPVKCALQWAFVPDEYVMTEDRETLKVEADETPVAALLATMIVPGTQTCGGLSVDAEFKGYGNQHFAGKILDSCDSNMATVAQWTWWLLAALFVGGAIFMITRSVAGVVGFRGVDSGASGGES